VADTGSFKLGYIAGMQAEFLAKNIVAQRKNRPLKAYKPMTKLMALVPTGPKTGLGQLPFAVTKAKWMVNMKQKDLFIAKTYNGLDTKPDAMDDNELSIAVPT
jgi:NADH dehydrogenase FAD-containing subunit